MCSVRCSHAGTLIPSISLSYRGFRRIVQMGSAVYCMSYYNERYLVEIESDVCGVCNMTCCVYCYVCDLAIFTLPCAADRVALLIVRGGRRPHRKGWGSERLVPLPPGFIYPPAKICKNHPYIARLFRCHFQMALESPFTPWKKPIREQEANSAFKYAILENDFSN
jgi:hypothetical protein